MSRKYIPEQTRFICDKCQRDVEATSFATGDYPVGWTTIKKGDTDTDNIEPYEFHFCVPCGKKLKRTLDRMIKQHAEAESAK